MGPGELRASEKNAIALNKRCQVLEEQVSDLLKEKDSTRNQIVSLQQQLNSLRGLIASQMGTGPTAS